ncbi:TetR-like C-terminal domain-containing protein [Kaistia sp. 32K]|uniref:TetR-like C-terminal domain-containing protein n=1 Tax=Kaistia sp. 32K TaxID=2795690 RepID=UPI0019155DE4|nr:TetR-like C-terminal domain-containing protein [Kaistia sp. 32K]
MSQASPPKRKPGRPPSAEARERALRAAHEILMAEGFGRLSIEAVAARSGVGKPTLYRNWANAQELALAALVANPLPEALAEGATARARLLAQMRGLVTAFATTRGRQVALALASADPQSEFTKAFRNKVILASRETGRTILQDAIAAGEMAPPPDLEALLDMIYAPVFYRLLVGHQPLDTALADAVVETVFSLPLVGRE